jgi:hypothetical protein
MPYAPNYQDQDEEKKSAPKAGAPTLNTVAPVGAAAPSGTGAGVDGQQGVGSGKFVNFDRIFNANKPDANNMATGVANDVGQKAESATQATNKASTDFNNRVQQGTNTYGVGSSTMSRDEQAQRAAQGYTGPNNVAEDAGYQDAQKQTQTAKDNLNLTKDAYGVQTYLQNQYGKQGQQPYTNGMSVWDAALTNAAGAGQFDALRQKYGNLDQMFSNAQAGSAQAVQNAQATTDDAQKIYGNNVAQYDQYAQNRAASTQAAQKAAGDKVSQYGGKDAYDRWVAAGMPTDVDSWITQDQGQHVKVKG